MHDVDTVVPGNFVTVAYDDVAIVDDQSDDADGTVKVATALVLKVDDDEMTAVWVYDPASDSVSTPIGLDNRNGGRAPFLTDEVVENLDMSQCTPTAAPALAAQVAHCLNGRFVKTSLPVAVYARIAQAQAGDAPAIDNASAAAQHSYENLVKHVDITNAARVAAAYTELCERLGRCPFKLSQ